MLVISCYIMVLFLFFGTCLFCYSYLHLLSRKLVAENPAEDGGERIGGFRASRCTSRVRLGRVTGIMVRFGGTAGWGSRPMMSGEFITSFTMVSAEFDTTAMRAFRYNGRISEYIYGTASLALCGRSNILCRLGS